MPSRGEMLGLARAAAERAVGHRPQQRLQELILALLRGAGIVIASENLLDDEAVQHRDHVLLRDCAQGRDRCCGK